MGWVDGLHVTLDEQRSALWFAPRKPTSAWSRPNKERIARLEREGRLLPAGRAAVEVAQANGAWGLLDESDNLVVSEDLAHAFALHPGAREQWDAFPPSARRAILGWIALARTAPTRAKRINETAERASRGNGRTNGRECDAGAGRRRQRGGAAADGSGPGGDRAGRSPGR